MMDRGKKVWRVILSLILCVAIGINWNVLRVNAAAEDEDGKNEDPIIIVSMGDSYSSGEGIEPFYGQDDDIETKVKNPDWLAHRSTKSWASLLTVDGLDGTLADHWYDGENDGNWFFVAASGAVTDNLLKTQKKEYDRDGVSGTAYLDPQLDVFDKFEKDTVDYVTFTFGGNDVGFSDIITTAVMDPLFSVPYINPRELTEKLNGTWDEFYTNDGTEENIKRAYENIADKAGANAAIIVAGYPKLLKQSRILITKAESQEINSNVAKFNQAIKTIVDSCAESGMNIYFVSVEEAFDGHEAYSADPYINEITFKGIPLVLTTEDLEDGVGPSAYSIHPNAQGAEAYAACVQAQIDAIEAEATEKAETETEAETSGSDGIWEKIEEGVDTQIDKAIDWFLKKLEERLNEWLSTTCGGC